MMPYENHQNHNNKRIRDSPVRIKMSYLFNFDDSFTRMKLLVLVLVTFQSYSNYYYNRNDSSLNTLNIYCDAFQFHVIRQPTKYDSNRNTIYSNNQHPRQIQRDVMLFRQRTPRISTMAIIHPKQLQQRLGTTPTAYTKVKLLDRRRPGNSCPRNRAWSPSCLYAISSEQQQEESKDANNHNMHKSNDREPTNWNKTTTLATTNGSSTKMAQRKNPGDTKDTKNNNQNHNNNKNLRSIMGTYKINLQLDEIANQIMMLKKEQRSGKNNSRNSKSIPKPSNPMNHVDRNNSPQRRNSGTSSSSSRQQQQAGFVQKHTATNNVSLQIRHLASYGYRIFRSIPNPDTIAYNSMIKVCAKVSPSSIAMDTTAMTTPAYRLALDLLEEMKCFYLLQLQENSEWYQKLEACYNDGNDNQNGLYQRDSVTPASPTTSMIGKDDDGNNCNDNPTEDRVASFSMYQELIRKGPPIVRIKPNVRTYCTVMDAYCQLGTIESAEYVESLLLALSDDSSNANHDDYDHNNNTRSDMYDDKYNNDYDTATATKANHLLFLEPNLIAYNTALTAWAKVGNAQRAMELLDRMMTGCTAIRPDVISYNTVLHALAKSVTTSTTTTSLSMNDNSGVAGRNSYHTSDNTMDSFQNLVAPDDEALRILQEVMPQNNIQPNSRSYTTVMDVLGRCNRPDDAYELLQEMITLYRTTGKEQYKPNTVSYSTVIHAYAISKQEHNQLQHHSAPNHIPVFDNKTELTDNITNSRINTTTKAMKAYKVYNQMIQDGIRPNRVTYNNLLNCCAMSVGQDISECQIIASLVERLYNLILTDPIVNGPDQYTFCTVLKAVSSNFVFYTSTTTTQTFTTSKQIQKDVSNSDQYANPITHDNGSLYNERNVTANNHYIPSPNFASSIFHEAAVRGSVSSGVLWQFRQSVPMETYRRVLSDGLVLNDSSESLDRSVKNHRDGKNHRSIVVPASARKLANTKDIASFNNCNVDQITWSDLPSQWTRNVQQDSISSERNRFQQQQQR